MDTQERFNKLRATLAVATRDGRTEGMEELRRDFETTRALLWVEENSERLKKADIFEVIGAIRSLEEE